MPHAYSNPFATRFIRPDAAEYVFPPGESAESLLARLKDRGWWGQIIGPHGCGKSTLVSALAKALASTGRVIIRLSLHDGQRQLPESNSAAWNSDTLVIVDGYEQLSWWSRWQLKSRCRRAGAGLLVTAHTSVGLPVLLEVAPSLEIAQQVVRQFLPGDDHTIAEEDVAQVFADERGNVRETLFKLYDLYHARRPA